MNTLLHICCAPCSVACVTALRAEGIGPTGFWFNPNIHPFTEYRMRKNTLVDYAKTIALPLHMQDEYGLRGFVRTVCDGLEHRCAYCYRVRLEACAAYAAAQGYDSFCTTLMVSPYQNYDLICRIGTEVGAQYHVPFLPRPFFHHFREGQEKARALGLYMQKYCGCIFSEEERYLKKNQKG
ncbi:MAG: epoxyqueuosine reductase QueH [Oscillospiraceae bacterium]|nr:epoxyqueuosine reductase QueH [Oscillospiraceae bacterium]